MSQKKIVKLQFKKSIKDAKKPPYVSFKKLHIFILLPAVSRKQW